MKGSFIFFSLFLIFAVFNCTNIVSVHNDNDDRSSLLSSSSPSFATSLSTNITNLLNECSTNQCFGVEWGIVIEQYDEESQQFDSLFELNPLAYFTPASNTKLLTTSVALLTLGEQYTIRTLFYTDSEYQPGQPIDTLCVVGQGDPSVTLDMLSNAASFFGKTSGPIRQLILDQSYYAGDPVPQGWEWEDLTSAYGALPTPLIVNENTITITVSAGSSVGDVPTVQFENSVDSSYLTIVNQAKTVSNNDPLLSTSPLTYNFRFTSPSTVYLTGAISLNQTGSKSTQFVLPILDPSTYFLNTFSLLLKESSNGRATPINVAEGICNRSNMFATYAIESPYLIDLVNWTLQQSDNLYAESILRQMGAVFNITTPIHPPNQATYLTGINYVASILQDMGVAPNLVKQVDGCGLDRANFITPRAFATVLENMFFQAGDPDRDFFSCLPTAGESGTLINRFVNTAAQGVVHAKTGSMTGVSSLSGVVTPQGIHNTKSPIIFSIISNNAVSSNSKINTIIDQIVVWLAEN